MLKSIFLWLVLLSFLPLITTAQEIIDPGISKYSVNVNQELLFSIKSKSELVDDGAVIIWDLGNGEQVENKEIIYQYPEEGEFLVTVYLIGEEEVYYDSLILNVTNINLNNSTEIGGRDNKSIIINELLPDPAGSDEDNEWIELKNIGNSTININDWIISDASQKQVKLTLEKFGTLEINSGGFLLLKRTQTKISLNNAGDTINLVNINNNIVDSATYGSNVPEAQSWARAMSNNWYWAIAPSPGFENIQNIEEVISSTEILQNLINLEFNNEEEEKEEVVLGYEVNVFDYENIKINEIFPNPKGDDRQYEFIELINVGEYEVNISGWYLTDESKYYYFPIDTTIKPKEYLLVNRSESNIALNNTGEQIVLYSSDEYKVDEVYYEQAYEDKSYSRTTKEEFAWTSSITPGEVNEFIEFEKEVETNYLFIKDISEIENLEKGTKVSLQGIVNVEPSIFGKQFFYLQDSQAGMQVYMNKADWPELKIGDVVEIKGLISESFQERRINLKDLEDIKIISNGIPPDPLEISEFDESQIGLLLKFQGQLIEKGSEQWWVLVDDEINVVFKFKNEKLSEFSEGDIIEVIGILRKRNDDLRIYPRTIEDLKLITGGQGLNIQEEDESDLVSTQTHNKKSKWIIVYSILLGIIVLLLGRLFILKKLTIKSDPHGR